MIIDRAANKNATTNKRHPQIIHPKWWARHTIHHKKTFLNHKGDGHPRGSDGPPLRSQKHRKNTNNKPSISTDLWQRRRATSEHCKTHKKLWTSRAKKSAAKFDGPTDEEKNARCKQRDNKQKKKKQKRIPRTKKKKNQSYDEQRPSRGARPAWTRSPKETRTLQVPPSKKEPVEKARRRLSRSSSQRCQYRLRALQNKQLSPSGQAAGLAPKAIHTRRPSQPQYQLWCSKAGLTRRPHCGRRDPPRTKERSAWTKPNHWLVFNQKITGKGGWVPNSFTNRSTGRSKTVPPDYK